MAAVVPLRRPAPQHHHPHPGPMPSNKPIALPPMEPHYVMPGSHWLDPPYSFKPPFPFPRQPWPFETESRAPGTGLIWGSGHHPWPPHPPKPPPIPSPCG